MPSSKIGIIKRLSILAGSESRTKSKSGQEMSRKWQRFCSGHRWEIGIKVYDKSLSDWCVLLKNTNWQEAPSV
jgi:hypothetical protein